MSQEQEGKGLPPEGGRAASNPRRRWTTDRKMDVVLRLLRGEGLDALSRECRVSAGDLERWRDEFIRGGREGLRARGKSSEAKALRDAQAKIGDLTMRLEITETALKKRGVVLPTRSVL